MVNRLPISFHLHLISDSTGETLTTIAKAAAVQYAQVRPDRARASPGAHAQATERVLQEMEQAPGIVLYTIINRELIEEIERRCRELKVPCLQCCSRSCRSSRSYLGAPQTPVVAGQHVVDCRLLPPHRCAELHHGA